MSSATPFTIVCEQKFSRRGLGYLWEHRTELSEKQEGYVKSIKSNLKSQKNNSPEAKQTITYRFSSTKAGKLGYGRLYGGLNSLETLERECRGTLCRDYYYDIDIVNAHPVLLVQLAKRKYNKDLPEVEKYVDDRDTYLTQIGGTRDDAKGQVIKILYGSRHKIPFLEPFALEVKAFTKFLAQQPEYAKLFEACKGEDNMYGTFLSYVLQTEERFVMLSLKDFFESRKWSVDVLAYDGVMIRKNDSLMFGSELLRDAEKAIAKDTEYQVSLISKEFSYYDVPESPEEVAFGISKEAYDNMKESFEINHFYFTPTNQYVEVSDKGIQFYDLQHATEYFSANWFFKKTEKFADIQPFFALWRTDPKRRIIHTIDYKPSEDPEVYNPPLAFAYHGVEPASDPTPYLELFNKLLQVNTGNNPILGEYVLKWLAHLIQKPFDLPGVGLVIAGIKGAGKDTLWDFVIYHLIGQQFAFNYEDNNQFFEKHDTGRKDKFLVKIEEADRLVCLNNGSKLKALITSPMSSYNPKGQKAYTAPNYTRFVMTTNSGNPVDMSDGERRFVVLPCSSELKGNFDFFQKVRDVLFTPQGGRAVAEYLMSVDLTGFNIRKLPENAYQEAVVDSEKSAEELFLQSWDGQELTSNELFELYRDYCVENNLRYKANTISFGKTLLKFIRDGKLKQERRNGNKSYYSK